MSDAQVTDSDKYAADMAALTGDKVEAPEKVEVEKVEPAATEVANTVDKVEESDTFDPATLSPSAKAYLDKQLKAEQDRYNALHGKTAPLQRELEQLKRQKQVPARAAAAPPAKTHQAADYFNSPEWKQYEKEWGAEAKLFKGAFEAQAKAHADQLARYEERFGKLDELVEKDFKPRLSEIDRMRAEKEDADYSARLDTFKSQHSDYSKHLTLVEDEHGNWNIDQVSPELQAFLEPQPDWVIEKFTSSDPDDAAWAMNQFKTWLKAEKGTVTTEPNAATTVQEARTKQLASRAVADTTGIGVARVDTGKLNTAEAYALEAKKLFGD